jgi:hypothetical protein
MYRTFAENLITLLGRFVGRKKTPPYKIFAKHAYERWYAKEYQL